VPSSLVTSRYEKVKTYHDLPDIVIKQIAHFFEHYKDLEDGKWVKIERFGDADDARRLIEDSIARAKSQG
jgi:inorganic pyrophosphatase